MKYKSYKSTPNWAFQVILKFAAMFLLLQFWGLNLMLNLHYAPLDQPHIVVSIFPI